MNDTPVSPATTPRLVEITDNNFQDAHRIRVREDQDQYVAPVVYSLAQAYTNRDTAWPRLLMDGDEAVGFIMVRFAPDDEDSDFRAEIWRLNIAEKHQGRGYGRHAVEGALAEARRRGFSRVTVTWVPGEGSPEGFYLGLGFRKTGRVEDGEIVGAIDLD
ncbi:GNAT family N-acetyltransferase [Nocardiopsis sp. L17-MgMaSL7]|uniref:GNAT family N-acetyltransferase n=1 Tax=Nocardiopsis sp. L17-MgMaSL7 TaxID=1938893 RepID=UPI000D70A2AF|nr:GNAT family N-acetyltransferase [Nocardiopsis sp. L17-MgMaSL7]PWV47221.1 diamine N-acetyltransferase [Nocardiopsis sp. L17-MgMaSL7]